MTDAALGLSWIAVLGVGLAVVVGVRRLGLSRTHARDLLHVGAGVWVLGWPLWHGVAWPVAIPATALLAVGLVPVLARRAKPVAALMDSVTGGDEGWAGIVLYVAAFAGLTVAGRLGPTVPPATALLALALGDGVGGLVGRVAGRHRYRVPWAKAKSLEGSIAVAVMAAAGAGIASAIYAAPFDPIRIAAVGVVAAVAEAVAPRATDNLLVPAAVWGLCLLMR